MTDTIEPMPELIDQRRLAEELVEQARAKGVGAWSARVGS